MGKNPLNMKQNLKGLQCWMEEKRINTLYSISEWDQENWLRWKTPTIPTRLKSQWEKLKTHFSGAAPINREEQDDFIWEPNGGEYTVKSGYNLLQEHQSQQDWSLWKAAWKTECLPKIKFFMWTLLKGKILTSENLKKKEYKGLLDV